MRLGGGLEGEARVKSSRPCLPSPLLGAWGKDVSSLPVPPPNADPVHQGADSRQLWPDFRPIFNTIGRFFAEPRTFEGYFMWALGNVGRLPSDSDDCCSWSDWHAIIFWQKKQVLGGASKMILAKIAGHYQCWSIILNWASGVHCFYQIAHRFWGFRFRFIQRKHKLFMSMKNFSEVPLIRSQEPTI